MSWKISSKSQILFLSSVGVCQTIMEFYASPLSDSLEKVYEAHISEHFGAIENFIKTVISGIILIRGLTGHLYIASYFLILYPLILGRLRKVFLLWMFLCGVRSIFLNLAVIIIGLAICTISENLNIPCFKFAADKAFELGCSIYIWTTVNDYYCSMKKGSRRACIQSPVDSPNSSEIVEDTSSSMFSEEWSLPASLVEEFQKTSEHLPEVRANGTSESSKNLKTRSVDSLLAQAMVEWFIKKIVKFKPKSENEASSPATMKSSDIAVLRSRIKKSIGDMDDSEFKQLFISDNQVIANDIKSNPKIDVLSEPGKSSDLSKLTNLNIKTEPSNKTKAAALNVISKLTLKTADEITLNFENHENLALDKITIDVCHEDKAEKEENIFLIEHESFVQNNTESENIEKVEESSKAMDKDESQTMKETTEIKNISVKAVLKIEDKKEEVLKTIPESVTCRRKYLGSCEFDKIPDLMNFKIINGQTIDIAQDVIREQIKIAKKQPQLEATCSPGGMIFEPLKAVSFVKHLFSERVEKTIEKTTNNSKKFGQNVHTDLLMHSSLSFNKENQVEYLHLDKCKNILNNSTSISANSSNQIDRAVDSSIYLIKSIVEDIINGIDNERFNPVTESDGFLKRTHHRQDDKKSIPTKNLKCEACKILKQPLKDTNILLDKTKQTLEKNASFNNMDPSSFLVDRNILSYRNSNQKVQTPDDSRKIFKQGSRDRIPRNTGLDKMWKTKKPYNKENEFENAYFRKIPEKSNEELNAKSLRYQFRRSRVNKVPIKRSKDYVLGHNSIKTILEDIKLKDNKNAATIQTDISSIRNKPKMIHNYGNNDYKNILKIQDTSVQTITTKKLLARIQELENE